MTIGSTPTMALPVNAEPVDAMDEKSMFRTIGWRLLPLLVVSYMFAFIDRINIGFALLQMKQTLPWNDVVYGIGAGLFFVGYLLFAVPSNLILSRIGARKTLLCIMVCWGIVASLTMFATSPMGFYVLRFLLGVFEAGFFSGVILYLTYWYPKARRGRIIALFMVAIPVSSLIAGPVSGAILKYMDGLNGWHGWQWIFLVQGLPASVLGILIYCLLPDRPELARWLSPHQKRMLRAQLDMDAGADATGAPGAAAEKPASFGVILRNRQVMLLSLVYLLTLGGNFTVALTMPTLIKGWGVTDIFLVGLYTSLPYIAGIIGMLAFGYSSDRFQERRWHFVVAMIFTVFGLIVAFVAQGHLVIQLAAIALTQFGMNANAPLLFTLATDRLSRTEVAGGVATVASLGGLGPAVMPVLAGALTTMTGSQQSVLPAIVAVFTMATLLAIRLKQ